MNQHSFCLIVARKGSQRLLNKNKLLLKGKPLFQWTLDAALTADVFDEIVVSSDDEEIISISQSCGVTAEIRPEHLCGSHVKASEVLKYFIEKFNLAKTSTYENFCLLQPTSPFRGADYIRNAMHLLETPKTEFVIGIKKYDCPPQFAVTTVRGVQPVQDKFLTEITRTQDVPTLYHPAGGIFAGKTKAFLRTGRFYGPTSVGLPLNHIEAWDINDQEDFNMAEIIAASLHSD